MSERNKKLGSLHTISAGVLMIIHLAGGPLTLEKSQWRCTAIANLSEIMTLTQTMVLSYATVEKVGGAAVTTEGALQLFL